MRKCVGWLFCAASGSVLIFVVLIFRYLIMPPLVKQQISKNLVVNEGTEAWDRFINPPVPFYLRIYIFNFVNPEEVFNGKKPVVKQVGPWVYKITKKKFNTHLDNVNDTVAYAEKSFFSFDEEKSKPLTENDYVQPANPIVPLVFTFIDRLPEINFLAEFLEIGFPEVLGANYGTALNVTVKELLFDGVTGHCSNNASLSAKFLCSSIANIPGQQIAKWDENGNLKFSVMSSKNDTYSKRIEVYRGNQNIDLLGQIASVNGQSTMPNWYGNECNSLAGTFTKTLLKPLLSAETNFRLFDEDICTGTPMVFDSSLNDLGVDVLRFQPSESFLGSVENYPENYCFCPGSIQGLTLAQSCMKQGAIEIGACRSVPQILSYPHFFKASKFYQDMIEGLSPNANEHSSYLDIEPNTGEPVSGKKRFQINFEMKGTPSLMITGQAPDVVMPLMWFEESGNLGDDEVELLQNKLLKLLRIISIVIWVLLGVGVAVTIIGLIMVYFSFKKAQRAGQGR